MAKTVNENCFLSLAGTSAIVKVDPDVAQVCCHAEWRYLAGRIIGLSRNAFSDLLTMIGGPGAIPKSGDPLDLRRDNLWVAKFELPISGCASTTTPIVFSPVTETQNLKPMPIPESYKEKVFEVTTGSSGLIFLPYACSIDLPNVSVDSIDNRSTLLSLSHWPSSRTPSDYRLGLSTRSVFAYLARNSVPAATQAVVSDHFDIDGLMGIYALLEPKHAQRHQDLLIEVAIAGDFHRFHAIDTAKIVFTLNSISRKSLASLDHVPDPDFRLAAVFNSALKVLPRLIEDIESFRSHWLAGLRWLDTAEALFETGHIIMREDFSTDLAWFSIQKNTEVIDESFDLDIPVYGGHLCYSFHNRTKMLNLAIITGNGFEVWQRYEGWVEGKNKKTRQRRDLRLLAGFLNDREPNKPFWIADGPEALTPRLRFESTCESSLSVDFLLSSLKYFLETAPPSWCPSSRILN